MIRKKSETSAGERGSSAAISLPYLEESWQNPPVVSGFTIYYPPVISSPHRSRRTPLQWLFAKVKEMWAFGS